MDIGVVSKQSGLPVSTLRYYEEKGLIRSIGRNGLRRVFDETVLERLALIALGRQAGFSLNEILSVFTEDGPKIDREQLLQRAEEIDRTIKQLGHLRDGLKHAAACSAPSHFECPKFQRLMNIAISNQRRHKKAAS
ncbi:MAG: helix-turn-helix domain-containing protein [Rhizobiales bacterium]|nr:helix-turn-helix domain-containing protein [Hyphomicrobiales bacterium]